MSKRLLLVPVGVVTAAAGAVVSLPFVLRGVEHVLRNKEMVDAFAYKLSWFSGAYATDPNALDRFEVSNAERWCIVGLAKGDQDGTVVVTVHADPDTLKAILRWVYRDHQFAGPSSVQLFDNGKKLMFQLRQPSADR